MARKSKRVALMALNEAIRQGQAKIAERSGKGQVPSEELPSPTQKSSEVLSNSDAKVTESADKYSVFLLKSKEKASFLRNFPQKTKLVLLLCASLVGAFVLAVWLVSLITADQSEKRQDQGVLAGGVVKGQDRQEPSQPVLSRSDETSGDMSKSSISEENSTLETPGGENVIWIQRIPLRQKEELVPVVDFFKRKGIETEIIIRRDKDDAVLVTKAGFEENPAKEGTDGYELLQRIKQLGPVYVEETKDTKFGIKPFQDVLGYKR